MPRTTRICFVKSKRESEQCRVLAKAYQEMKEAAAVLDKKPDDARPISRSASTIASRKAIGKRGCPCWPSARTKRSRPLAGQEIAGVTKADDQVKVGDAWWNLAEKEQGKVQVNLRGRANYWYQQALPELSGLAKAKLEKRIKEYEDRQRRDRGDPPRQSGPAKYLPGLVAQYYNDIDFQLQGQGPSGCQARLRLEHRFARPGRESPELSVSAGLGYIKAPKAGRYVIHARGHYDCQVTDRQCPRHRESSDAAAAYPISRPKSI